MARCVELTFRVKSLGELPCRDRMSKQSHAGQNCACPSPHLYHCHSYHAWAQLVHQVSKRWVAHSMGSLQKNPEPDRQDRCSQSLNLLVEEQLSCNHLFHLAGAEEEGGHVQHEEAVPPGAFRLQPRFCDVPVSRASQSSFPEDPPAPFPRPATDARAPA